MGSNIPLNRLNNPSSCGGFWEKMQSKAASSRQIDYMEKTYLDIVYNSTVEAIHRYIRESHTGVAVRKLQISLAVIYPI